MRSQKNRARSILLCAVVGLCVGLSGAAWADEAAKRFEIREQPLAQALMEFGVQSGLTVVAPSDLTSGKMVRSVSGELVPTDALTRLLEGSGLTFSVGEGGTIAVHSQVAVPPIARAEEGSRSEGEDGAGEEAARGVKLEEIVVTAQKREERLQDVPMSIAVLKGADLDSFTGDGISEALAFVPGVTLTQGDMDGGRQLGVRGVTASGPVFNGSSPIAYYLDSVPFGLVKSAAVPDTSPYDLERIEVLRGPHGTLYGASALNGVIRVLTHDADLEEFELKARTSVSATQKGSESYRGDVALNVPIVSGKLGARAVVGYQDVGGWIDSPNDRDINNGQIHNVRVKLNAQPTGQLSIGLSAWRFRADYEAPPLSDDDDFFPGTGDKSLNNSYDVLGLKLRYDFSGMSVSSSTGYIDYATDTNQDGTMFPGVGVFHTVFGSDVLSQEIMLSSTGEGAWRWSAGAFYRDSEDRLVQDFATVDFTDTSTSMAVFGELTRRLMNGKLELTGGLRYFEDDVAQIENVRHCGALCPGDPLFRDDDEFDAVSPRAVLTWHPGAQTTVYGSYSEGFRSGFNQNANVIRAAPSFPPVKEDTLRNYEIGAKGAFWGGHITYDTSAYYINWKDVQQTLNIVIDNFCCFSGVANGESASGPGIDLAVNFSPTEALELGAGFSWNDLALDGPVIQNGIVLLDEGDRLLGSFEYTANVHGGYAFVFGGGELEGRFSVTAAYTSERPNRFLSGNNIIVTTGDETFNLDTRFSVRFRDNWTATLFVDNATNDRGAPVGSALDFFVSRVRPRTTGLQFEYRL